MVIKLHFHGNHNYTFMVIKLHFYGNHNYTLMAISLLICVIYWLYRGINIRIYFAQ